MIASHNTWTYLPVKSWWMKLISGTARCQDKIESLQYAHGANVFDLRIRMDGSKAIISHGAIDFKGDPASVIKNVDYPGVYVQVVNEDKVHDSSQDAFLKYVNEVLKPAVKNIKWVVIGSKKAWNVVEGNFPITNSYSCFWMEDRDGGVIPNPKKYASEHNAENYKKMYDDTTDCMYWFDYIQ